MAMMQESGAALGSDASEEEAARPGEREQKAFRYIRSKVNQLLEVMGTLPLGPEELDDETLLDTDAIGTVAESFRLVLEHLHRTNERLRLANDEIGAILDSAGAGILVVDREHRIVALNRKVTELFAARRRETVGRTCLEAICRAGAPPQGCVLRQVLTTGNQECRCEWVRGKRHFAVVGRPIRDGQGAITHVVIVYAEITERIRAEAALREALANAREARERVDGILRSVADGLLVTDLEQRILLMNPRAEALLGGGLAELAGRPLGTAVGDGALREAIRSAAATGEATKADFTLPGAGPEILEGRISVLRSAEGAPAGMIVIMHDVTQERAVERMKSEFVTTAAHEFRTPLTAIMGFSELMLDGGIPAAEQREFLRLIHDKAEALARIVNNLLDISRIESGEELSLNRSVCSLQEILDAVLPAFVRRSERHTFEVADGGRPILLEVDQGCIEEVFENVLSNAVKYSPDGGTVRILCETGEEGCRIAVADQGVGMTGEQAGRVFDKFYRADNSNTAIRGTGLGMTIVRYIIEAHGCRIWLDSRQGEGTTVHFTLPLAASPGGPACA
jgi:two-component system phosphate regulon sensor histidine kinase PhoR